MNPNGHLMQFPPDGHWVHLQDGRALLVSAMCDPLVLNTDGTFEWLQYPEKPNA